MERNYHLHIEAAISIQKQYNIKTIVEFGAGEISTYNFLKKSFFPELYQLYSLENDKQWIDSLDINDDRWNPIIVPNECQYLLESSLINFHFPIDVVLVDSSTIEGRINILKYLAKRNDIQYIILHDSQRKNYDNAKSLFKNKVELTSVPAHATILSNIRELSNLV